MLMITTAVNVRGTAKSGQRQANGDVVYDRVAERRVHGGGHH